MSKIKLNKFLKFFTLTGFFLSFIFFSANAQTNVIINGKVIESRTKTPLSGASISLSGSTNVVTTNNKGEFKFSTYHQLPFVLVISFIGYQTQEIHVSNTDFINVSLVESPNQLSDVVVVGYGTQRRKDVTGSIVSVPKAILSQPVSSPESFLEGSVAGVAVTQSSGQPGAASSVIIRGGNSIIGANEPLYVVDGFPIFNDNTTGNTGLTYSGGDLNVLATINPNDIESIDVLKDASATAIYGTRGANGVVIITTKKGTRGTDNVSYQAYVGTQKISKEIPLLNGSQWATEHNNIIAALPPGPNNPIPYTQAQIDSIGAGSNWEDAALRTALTQSHQVTVSGGDEKSRYYISGNYANQQGIVINTGFTRIGANLGYEKTISSKFKFGINAIVSHSTLNGLGGEATSSGGVNNFANNAFVNALYNSPAVAIYGANGYNITKNPVDGTFGTTGIAPNPIADLASVTDLTYINRTLGSFYGEYKIVKDLTLKVSFNGDLIDTRQDYYAPSFSAIGISTKGFASVGSEQTINWLNENTLTYDHNFNDKHFLTILAGYTTSDETSQTAVANATNFYTDAISFNNLNSGTATLPSSYGYEEVLNSFLGRVNYSFEHRYNLTASLRADGSSKFPNHPWGYFPAVGFSWNISDEDFARGLKKSVNNLKLRLSAGTTGNQEISGIANPAYPTLANLAPDNYSFGGTLTTGLYSTTLANPKLTWETTAQYDAGIDAGVLNNRINFSFDAYYKKTTNLFLNVSVPQTTGYSSELENLGSVQNEGIELGINSDNLKSKDFSWRTSFTFATNSNKVLSLGGQQSIVPAFSNPVLQIQVPLILEVGQPVGSFFGYRTNGIVQSTDNLATIPKPSWITAAPQPGDVKYVDQNKDGIINGSDKVILGNAQPKFTAGLSNTFAYKNFDLLVFLQGSYGGKIFNALRQQLEITTLTTNSPEDVADAWTPTNPSNTVPRVTNAPTAVVSDRFIEDASYLRIKTLSLGYTLPGSFASKILAKSLRIYISAQNLVTWTKYTGFDPEASSYEQSTLNTGIDYGAYPTAKTYLVGLNVTF